MTTLVSEQMQHRLRLEWLNASFQRAKKIPQFDTLIRSSSDRKPSLSEIAERFDLKPKE